MFFGGLAIDIPIFCVVFSAAKKESKLINQYNDQILSNQKPKYTSELRFGVSPSGGLGLTLNF
jgi:hypothetical protein